MKIVVDNNKNIAEARNDRYKEQVNLLSKSSAKTLLVLKSSLLQEDRRVYYASYGVIMIYLDIKKRLSVSSLTYTFTKEGMIFFLELNDDAQTVKRILVNYEDNHPFGFSVDSEVYALNGEITRKMIGYEERKSEHGLLTDLLNEGVALEKDYLNGFKKSIEKAILVDDYDEVVINITLLGLVAANTKEFGFGCHGPNYSSNYYGINYNQFLTVLEVLRDALKPLIGINTFSLQEVLIFQQSVEDRLRVALHTQRPNFYFMFIMTMIVCGFVNSRSFVDMTFQIKSLYLSLYEIDVFSKFVKNEDSVRYYVAKNGFKEGFGLYLNFFQKNHEIIPTLLYIISKNEDQSIVDMAGYQSLQKAQFLAKNLIQKKDHWDEFDQWCHANHLAPYDSTQILAAIVSLDYFQRYFSKIKLKRD